MLYNLNNIPDSAAILEIKKWQDITLPSEPVSIEDIQSEDFQKLVWSMIKTCKEKNGIGLAAPQIGVFKQLFIRQRFDKKKNKFTNIYELYINPSFKTYKNEGCSFGIEGCLSVPEETINVKRSNSILAKWFVVESNNLVLKNEKLTGFSARVFQHEYDHLIGQSITQK